MSHLVLDSERIAVHKFLNSRFSNREKLHQAQADAEAKDRHAKFSDIPLNTLEAALGKPLHHVELMKRLRKCNANLYFELSPVTKRYGIYVGDPLGKPTSGAPGARLRYLGMSIAHGISPEFTPKFIKEDGSLRSVENGYRTVLARLLRGGYITEPQIVKHFGVPSVDSSLWQKATT